MERLKLPLVGFNFGFIIYMLIFASGLVTKAPDTYAAVGLQAVIAAGVGLVIAGILYAVVSFAGK